MINKYNTAQWPYFSKDMISAVSRVLCSGKVNQWTGNEVRSFEKEYAAYLGLKYTIALANGSVALDVALMALGIGSGDEVIVPSRSFVASASCVALRGATPIFSDIDRESQNITLENVKKVFNPKVKAIIAVHLAGWPCKLDELRNFCDEKGIFLIEDCAQAHGARYKGRPVGSFGDVACFSFCQDKIISTGGEGGLLATDNKRIWCKAWSLKDHGRDYRIVFSRKKSKGFLWAVSGFGSNYRMTEMQAAIGRIALKKLDGWVKKRRMLANILMEGFKYLPQLRVTVPGNEFYHSYYKYYAFVRSKEAKAGINRDRIILRLNNLGIQCKVGICPEIYMEKAFRKNDIGITKCRMPIARELGMSSLMFQVHPTLKKTDMYRVIEGIKRVLK